jgi:diguanylate cyclase (GGDEF)-like protein
VQGGEAARGLLLALFQRREYLEVESERYGALAAAGHLVVVGAVGPLPRLPPGVHGVTIGDADLRARSWLLLAVRGPYASLLEAHDEQDIAPGETTLEAGRLFTARWSVRRDVVLARVRTELARLAGDVAPEILAGATAVVDLSSACPVSAAEPRLAAATDDLVDALDAGERRAARLRLSLEQAEARAERDQLTGLRNRHFLERYLGSDDRPADLVTLLVDVDDLKVVNDTYGHDAGDAVISAVGSILRRGMRPGDVVVRWGGDEFLVLAPVRGGESGLVFAERLAEVVAAGHPDPPWDHLPLSVSVGVCTTRRTPLPLERLDAALRGVKHAGKGHAALARGSHDETGIDLAG